MWRTSVSAAIIAIFVAVLSFGAGGVGALDHPGHEQADRGNGPAADDVGKGRGNPTGANGTIKIDGSIFDGHPNNEPHIGGCAFQVDFYGFDVGDTASLSFYQWPGTGNKSEILTVETFIGEDGAGGGIDIDQQLRVVLDGDLGNEHPLHGFHIRAEANVTSGDRTYTKTKVFWVTRDCDSSSGGY